MRTGSKAPRRSTGTAPSPEPPGVPPSLIVSFSVAVRRGVSENAATGRFELASEDFSSGDWWQAACSGAALHTSWTSPLSVVVTTSLSRAVRGPNRWWSNLEPRGHLHIHHSRRKSGSPDRDHDLQVKPQELRQLVHHSTRCARRPCSRPPERPREACSEPSHLHVERVSRVRRTPLPSSTSSTVVQRAAAPPV